MTFDKDLSAARERERTFNSFERSFKFAEYVMKFLGWEIVLIGLAVVSRKTGNTALGIVAFVLELMLAIVVLDFSTYIASCFLPVSKMHFFSGKSKYLWFTISIGYATFISCALFYANTKVYGMLREFINTSKT